VKLVLFVLNDAEKTLDLLSAWKENGVGGATVLISTGMGRLHLSSILRDDLPLIPSLSDFYTQDEKLSRTIFTVVDDDSLVEKIIQATEQVVGSLEKPGNGILMVLPLDSVHGLIHYSAQTSSTE
jgi:nitrogen regulatory protein P-II 1